MIPFLKSLALAYASRYPDMSEFCFLFPNKRSGTFFLKYLKEANKTRTFLTPDVRSISEFVEDLSGRVVATRIDLLFLLYQTYREIINPDDQKEEGLSFDTFRMWGETVLSDFNDVDMHLVDTDKIFKNVKDFRELTANFHTEEQKEVMEEYFGYVGDLNSVGFWKNFDCEDEELTESKRKFIHLWRILSPLYEKFKGELETMGLTTSGGAYRLACERLEEEGRECLPYKKIVCVGFNALSISERTIFKLLRDMEPYECLDGFCDFFWDATGPVLSLEKNSASKYVRSNIKSFPCPEWAKNVIELSDKSDMPSKLTIASSPGNVSQTKIVGEMLYNLKERLKDEAFEDARVAVVLADEGLLLPMLYSLPEGIKDVNLTMGYPMKLTSVVSFVSALRRLMQSMRKSTSETVFYHREVRSLLSHPYTQMIITTPVINKILNHINKKKRPIIGLNELIGFSDRFESLLSWMKEDLKPAETIEKLDCLLNIISSDLNNRKDGMLKSRLEISHIDKYRDILQRLEDIVERYDVSLKAPSLFRLIDRLLSTEKIGFEGEPLTGLQVMGLLETRSIDFDYIYILSANERILPMRSRTRTFIPDSLRIDYHMPPSNYSESIFAYYFYRMISRAKEVTMIYDARSEGLKSGDVSRYLLQLRHLFAENNIEEQEWKFILSGKRPFDASVNKTKEVRETLDAFMADGSERKNLSASALTDYIGCQVKFYYKDVMNIEADPTPTQFIDAITIGNVVHHVMQRLYVPSEMKGEFLTNPIVLSKDIINGLLKDEEYVELLIRQEINMLHFNKENEDVNDLLTGGAEIVASQIKRQIIRILRHDHEIAPVHIFGCEISKKVRVEMPDGRVVNFNFAIDRMDEVGEEKDRYVRIVDYKTGRIKLKASDFDSIFTELYYSGQIFQLYLYAWLIEKLEWPMPCNIKDIRLEIYDANKINKNSEPLYPEIGGVIERTYGVYSEEFDKKITSVISEIFDSPSFNVTENDKECTYCSFKSLCRRQ